MVCEVMFTKKLGIKIILRCEIFPNDKYFITTLFIIENNSYNVINPPSRLFNVPKPLLQQLELLSREHVPQRHI